MVSFSMKSATTIEMLDFVVFTVILLKNIHRTYISFSHYCLYALVIILHCVSFPFRFCKQTSSLQLSNFDGDMFSLSSKIPSTCGKLFVSRFSVNACKQLS